jgi:hypothetical protein
MVDAPVEDDLYLFLFCPQVQLQDGHLSIEVPRQSEAHFWSFSPDRKERLTESKAEELGVPKVLLQTLVYGQSWSKQQYNLIHEVQLAKGFNPETSELAKYLDYPLPIIHHGPLRVPLDGKQPHLCLKLLLTIS